MSNNYDILDEDLGENKKIPLRFKLKVYAKKVYYRFFKKEKKENFILTIIVHLLFHILLLSILESIFFFQYASIIETQTYINNLGNSLKEIKKYDIEQSFNVYDSEYKKIKLNITNIYYNYYNDDNINNYFIDLKSKSEIGKLDRIDNNTKLYHKSFNACYMLGSIFVIFLLFVKYNFKLYFKKLLVEHILFMLGIGLYEYWFFSNIVIKFNPLSSEETNYLISSCGYSYFNKKNNIFRYNINCDL